MLLWAIAAAALGASPCRDLATIVDDAWVAFDDAEVEGARALLVEAHDSVTCQARVLSTDELVELYRLDALVSLSQEDKPGAVYATIRAVVAAANDAPLEDLGPELQKLHATWLERMEPQQGVVDRVGGGSVYLDGRELADGATLDVIQGEHVVQIHGPDGWRGAVVDIGSAYTVDTGITPPPVFDEPLVEEPSVPVAATSTATTRGSGGSKGRRIALLAASGVVAAGGAMAVGIASGRESTFLDNPYADPEYRGCRFTDDCYSVARADVIRSDALTTNVIYGMGYGLMALGVATAGVELFVLPSPTSTSATVRLRW